MKDCNSGKRSHVQSSSMTQEVALTEWVLQTEIDYNWTGSQHQAEHPRQQQQQLVTLKEGVNSTSKEVATWESRAGMRDETKKRHGGNGHWKQWANRFKSERLFSSQWTGSRHRCTLGKTKRILQKSKEWTLVRTNLEFAKTERLTRWCSVKNHAVLPWRWAMWSWSSWRKTRFYVHHVCITYLRVH